MTGPLYAEISPRTFPVLVRTGSRLSQIRFRRGEVRLTDAELAELHARTPLVGAAARPSRAASPSRSTSPGFDGLVGYRAKRHTGLVDVDAAGRHRAADFWEPLRGRRLRRADPRSRPVLHPGLEGSGACAARPRRRDGAVRSRWSASSGSTTPASSIPGFGYAEAGGTGARAVLEVRSRDVPFLLEDGQIVGRLVYERMAERPASPLRRGAGSNYQAQGLKLSKHFV